MEFLLYVMAGFAAQLIDGALSMAYGVSATSLLLALGAAPAAASATVHAAECFTTGASAVSHRVFGNIDGRLFRKLVVPGVVATTLIVRGNDVRQTVGTVNAAEFFVTVAASVTFILTLGVTGWPMIAGLALGGLLASPLGAWACRRIPIKPFMILVGVLVIALSTRTLLVYYGVR